MSSVKKFLSDTAIYGLTTIVSRMLGFLMTPLYLRKFKAAADYGVYSNFYAWVSMLNAILAFGMETTYFRFLQKVEKGDKEKVYNNSFLVILFISVLLFASVFLFTRPIAAWFAEGEDITPYVKYVKYFAIILITDALAVVPFAKLRADGRPIRYSCLKFINILVMVASNIFFIVLLPQWIESSSFWANVAGNWYADGIIGFVFLSNLLASSITLVLLLPELLALRFRLDKGLLREMLAYSFPILVANISYIINENLDKMIFPKLLPGPVGMTDLGIYSAVAKLAIFLQLFVTAFRLGAEPFFFSYAKNENAQKVYAKIMQYFVVLMVLVMVALVVNLSWLKKFIRGNEFDPEVYWTGLKIVPILLFNFVLLGIYMNLSVWYKLTDQTRFAFYITGIGAVITIALNVLLIPKYSYVGAVLSTTVVYIVMITTSLFWGQKYYPIPYPFFRICAYLFLALFVSYLSFVVFESNFWIGNGMLIIVMTLIAFSEREQIQKFIVKK